jgi:hypothetical protein
MKMERRYGEPNKTRNDSGAQFNRGGGLSRTHFPFAKVGKGICWMENCEAKTQGYSPRRSRAANILVQAMMKAAVRSDTLRSTASSATE